MSTHNICFGGEIRKILTRCQLLSRPGDLKWMWLEKFCRKTTAQLKWTGINWFFFCHLIQGGQLCDSLFSFPHTYSILKRVYSKRKELLPMGANSF